MFQLFYSPFSRIVVYQSRKEAVVFSCTPIFFCDKRSRFQPPFLVLPSTSIHSSVVCGLALFVLLFQMKYQKEEEWDRGEPEKQEAIKFFWEIINGTPKFFIFIFIFFIINGTFVILSVLQL